MAGSEKEMFISGGENVYPAEVEVALGAHPAVAECAVVGMPDSRWGEVGCAFVTLRGADLDPAAVKLWLRERLAPYKVPKRFVVLDELPRNASGKAHKPTLAQEALSHAS
jgi:fatty-acyl-CoA synthase